jgi:tetratricopeptide (TPR) repeat protein
LHNLIQKLLQQSDITAARAAYDKWDSVIGARLLKEIESQIVEAELINAAQSKPFREALATLDKAVANGFADKGRIEELVLYLYGKEANRIAATGDWLAAADIASQGVKRVPGNAQLTQAAAGFRKNYVVTIHNQFAQLFNAKQYEQARTLLLGALKIMPEDKTLLDDLKTVQSQLK